MNDGRRISTPASPELSLKREDSRRFVGFVGVFLRTFFCAGMLWLSVFSFGAVWPEDMTHEQRYWEKVQQEKAAEELRKTVQENSQREAIKASLPALVEAGAAYQPEIIVAKDGPPVIVKPSWFDGKGDTIVFSISGLLIIVFFFIVLVRFRREAEIRELTGGYLSDGTEVASFKMPELFAPVSPKETLMAIWNESEQPVEVAAEDPRQAFFASFPEYFAQMRDSLQELGRTIEAVQQQKILGDMAELIGAYKVEANMWQLRPIMQVSTVLELLLQRLAEKPKDISASALRTIAGALDLIRDLAVPDLRADLLIMPPLKILAVDDEPLCLRALTFALQKANLTPDLAHDGQEAVELARKSAYDVVFMDINMPVMDGFNACTEIRETALNTNTPVVFVTVQSDFQTRAKSNLIGGRDFMAKPFLIFELTVKAVTYAARKRLKPIGSSMRPRLVQLPTAASTLTPTSETTGEAVQGSLERPRESVAAA